MRVLAIDTATEATSVALLSAADPSWPHGDAGRHAGADVIGRYEESGKSHAQQILGMVDAVLAEGQITLSMLNGIAASVGPGAFTGVRISVAVAQGLAFGAGLTVVPVMTLEALALQAVRSGAFRVLACLDARMGEVYWGCFAADAVRGVVPAGVPAVGPPQSVRLPDEPRMTDAPQPTDTPRMLATLRPADGAGVDDTPRTDDTPRLSDVPGVADALPLLGAARQSDRVPAANLVGSSHFVYPPDMGGSSQAAPYRGIGRGFSIYPSLAAVVGLDPRLIDGRALPNARDMAWLGALRLAAGEGLDPAQLRPVYLRDKVALTEAERRQAGAR